MEFRILGPLELWQSDRPVEISAAKQRDLLALMLLNRNQDVGRDQLIDALWDGAPPPTARATLHSCVYRLRRTLRKVVTTPTRDSVVPRPEHCDPDITLSTRPAGYRLDLPPDAVDLHQFERLVAEGWEAFGTGSPRAAVSKFRASLALWRGDVLANVTLPAVRAQAARIDGRRLDVIEQCLAAELTLLAPESVIPELQALTGEYPVRERLWELLMTALHGAGRQADALAAYQTARRSLASEVGLEPGSGLQRIQYAILAGSPTSVVGGATGPRQELPRPPSIPVQEKARLVLSILAGDTSVTEAAHRAKVAETTVEEWKRQFLEGGRAGLEAAGAFPSPPSSTIGDELTSDPKDHHYRISSSG